MRKECGIYIGFILFRHKKSPQEYLGGFKGDDKFNHLKMKI